MFADFALGNNYGLGEIRNAELKGSCQALGIDPTRCLAKDHPDLQDNPKEWWQKETIQEVVMKQAKLWNIDTVSLRHSLPDLTFLSIAMPVR
jgi:N-acetylglucosaminylphosphatidylinositol deacetylase